MGAYGVKYKEAVTKLEEEMREDVVRQTKNKERQSGMQNFFLVLISALKNICA